MRLSLVIAVLSFCIGSVHAQQYAFRHYGALWIAHETGLTTLDDERVVTFPLVLDAGHVEYVNGMAGEPARGVLCAV